MHSDSGYSDQHASWRQLREETLGIRKDSLPLQPSAHTIAVAARFIFPRYDAKSFEVVCRATCATDQLDHRTIFYEAMLCGREVGDGWTRVIRTGGGKRETRTDALRDLLLVCDLEAEDTVGLLRNEGTM